jgi:hypothetical protein
MYELGIALIRKLRTQRTLDRHLGTEYIPYTRKIQDLLDEVGQTTGRLSGVLGTSASIEYPDTGA